MHTSLKGGEHVVLSFSCQRVNFLLSMSFRMVCAVFLAFLISTQNNQTNQRGGP